MGQENFESMNMNHVKSCPYFPGTANHFEANKRNSFYGLQYCKSGEEDVNSNNHAFIDCDSIMQYDITRLINQKRIQ
ncbi:hypothetical protein B4U80_08492 [Leptotrombidium deliense]|uniref:Uncharacterized protein n=1 Tax=Leptotrombidium deliense TaxID=299467 RepID=A0A443STP8_9ACAR|nr:hypothetical protein B4U80_08492 [Leptotrombidium deliense]